MNDETYDFLIECLNNEITKYKLKINYFYGCYPKLKCDNELYETYDQLLTIRTFIRYVHEKLFDKRFYDLMFSSDLSPNVDMRKLTHVIVEMVVNARKIFPRKVKE